MIEREIILHLEDPNVRVRIPVSQFDTMWRFVFTILYKGQTWEIPTGAAAILSGRKPDGNVFAFEGTVAGNRITVDCDVQMTAAAGSVVCELSVLSGGKTVGTANFMMDVEAAPKSPDDVSSETTLPAYGEILDRLAELEPGGKGGGTADYEGLFNKPRIGGVVLQGDKTLAQLGAAAASDIPTKTSDLQNDSGFIVSAPVTSVNGKTGAVILTKSDVDLENVNNTADASKPVSGPQQVALAAKEDRITEVAMAADGVITQVLEPGKIYHFTGSLTALTISFATFITAHPADCVVPAGSTATFSVAAIGDGMTYLWQELENGQWTDTAFATSRTNTLSMNATTAHDGKEYRCVVTDQNGNQVISRPAAMIIGSPESGGANTVAPMLTQYHFDFTTGSTAPTVTLPDSVVMPDGFSVEANKRYEVDILNNYGAVMAWAIS